MTENRKKHLLAALFILIFCTVAFVWKNSLTVRAESLKASGSFLALLTPILRLFLPEKAVTMNLVRKIAHFLEFSLLGAEFVGVPVLLGKHSWKDGALCLFFGLLTACVDETLQLFLDRGPSLKDVWLDMGGVVFGTAVMWLLVFTIKRRKQRAA